MAEDCLFCKIAAGEIKAEMVYEDERVAAFKDINPAAPHHVLIIPKKHIPTVNDLGEEDMELVGHMFLAAKKIAASLGVDGPGYRLVFNTNKDAGQLVFHLHLHLLAGRKMGWPPG